MTVVVTVADCWAVPDAELVDSCDLERVADFVTVFETVSVAD